jgi:hypothetical protein
MRSFLISAILCLLFVFSFSGWSRSEVSLGISADKDGISSFHLAIGEFYRVPEQQMTIVRERNIPDEEMPVVFFLAGRADVKPETIIKMRLGGNTWMAISAHYGLTAEAYYVPVTVDPGPPYGKAYGHFKNRDRNKWKTISLSDDDIINLVNLKFISDYYQCPADDVIKQRSNGKNFVDINAGFKTRQQQKKEQSKKQAAQEKGKGKGKGKK